MNRLQENIAAWSCVDPKHAVLLPYSEDHTLEACVTKKGELNLKREQNTFHSSEGAELEAKNWFSELNLEGVSVLYVYGVGLGYHYNEIKSWLKEKQDRYVVFLEDDLSVIYRLFETEIGSEILKDERAHLYYFDDIKSLSSHLELIFWHCLNAKILVSALPFYEAAKSKKYTELQHEIVHETVKRNATVDEYLRYGASFYRNFYNNMRLLADSYLGNHFFGQFKGVPAVICGAGPSLEKNIDQLADLNDRALIFAGGSAMNALNAKGIIPHFGAGIDPNAPQYDRLLANTAFEVPYFYRNRMFWKAFRLIHGPRLYVTGSGGYEVSKVFDEAFGWEEEELDEGHNVVNFCVELANHMGCDPIIFVGVDLAFTERQAYATGVVSERGFKEDELLASENLDATPIERKDIFGKPIHTLWKWIAESEWIANYARENPRITLINSTEGGLGFPGVQNVPLKKVDFSNTYDLSGRVHGETQNAHCPQVTEERVIQIMNELKESLKRCIEHLEILLRENQILQAKDTIKTTQSGLSVLAETELEEEPAYHAILEVFSGISSMLLNYEFRNLNKSQNPDFEKLKLNEKKLKYVSQAAAFNLALLEDSLKENPEYARD